MSKDDAIEDLIKLSPQNWKEKVILYERIISLMKDSYPTTYFETNTDFFNNIIDECNALALEKALELIIHYIKISDIGKKNLKSQMLIFIDKCFKSSRQLTRTCGIDFFVIQYDKCPIEVMECLMTFLNDTKPVIVNGVIETLIEIVKKYRIAFIKKLVNGILKLFESRDKQTRALVKVLTIEIGRANGRNLLEPLLKELKPIHLNDIRSELDKFAFPANSIVPLECGDDEPRSDNEVLIELPLVDFNAFLTPGLIEKLDGSRQDRKDALDTINDKITNKRLSNGNYREFVKKLSQIVCKDSQINSVVLALNILIQMARSLGKHFVNYSLVAIEACLEKFKEKKSSVLSLTRDCIDASYATTTFEPCLPVILESLDDKNPSIRSETVAFLLRISDNKRTNDAIRKQLKSVMPQFRKLCDDSVLEVRDQIFQMIGRLSSTSNTKAMTGFLEGLDGVKLQRIRSYMTKEEQPMVAECVNSETKKVAVVASKVVTAKTTTEDAPKKKVAPLLKLQKEIILSQSDIDDKCAEMFGEENIKRLESTVWQNRLTALDNVMIYLKKTELSRDGCQVVVRFMMAQPGLKESNVTVLRKKIEIINTVFREHKPSALVADMCVPEIVEKLGDAKVGSLAKSVLTILFDTITDLNGVTTTVLQTTIKSKSVRCTTELLTWLIGYLSTHETRTLGHRDLIPSIRQLLASPNQNVKSDTISLIVEIYKKNGRPIVDAFDTEKPVLIEMMEKGVAKVEALRKLEKKNEPTKQKNIVNRILPAPVESCRIQSAEHTKSRIEAVSETSRECSPDVTEYENDTNVIDDVRSFVFETCSKLNSYIQTYSESILEVEFEDIFSRIAAMGDQRMQSIAFLKSVLNKTTKVQSVAVQTETTQTTHDSRRHTPDHTLKPLQRCQEPLQRCMEPPSVNSPKYSFVTHRRQRNKFCQQNNEINRDNEVDQENMPDNAATDEKLTIFDECRGDMPEMVQEALSIDSAICALKSSNDQPFLCNVLTGLVDLLEPEQFDPQNDDICRLVAAIVYRLSVILKDNSSGEVFEKNLMNELDKVVHTLSKIYNRAHFAVTVDDNITVQLLYYLFTIVNNKRGQCCQISREVLKSVNALLLYVVETSDTTKILFSLFNLLNQCFETGNYKTSFSNMIVKIIWNRMKIVKENVVLSDDYLQLILEVVNTLFKRYMSVEDVVDSIAFKSVKTFVDSLTKLRGLNLLLLIPVEDNENLTNYIHRCHDRATN